MKLSIIVPVYNVAKYLTATLENVTTQEGFDRCELLLINDGSTDASISILQHYANLYDNIRIIDKHNEGVSATRNRGIDEAYGEYIYFMDADDLLHPKAISIILDEIETNNPDVIAWRFNTFYTRPRYTTPTINVAKWVNNEDKRAFNYLTDKGSAVSLCSKAIRRRIFENPIIRLIPGMTFGEDMFVSWKCIIKAESIRFIDFPLYFYRQTGNSAIFRYHSNLYETYRQAFDDIKKFIIKMGLKSKALMKDLDYHFAKRIPALTLMEARAPYGKNKRIERLSIVLNDKSISRALLEDDRLKGDIYDLAREKAAKQMITKARMDIVKSKLLLPVKRLLK